MTDSITISSQRTNAWFVQSRTNPQARLRLFCFPYAGGGSLIYRNWSDSLPKTVELFPVDLPGRGRRMREAPFTRIEHLVPALAEALRPQLDKPFAFFGHSMGAMISYELARLLEWKYGLSPVHVFVSSRRAPQLANDEAPTYNLPEKEFLDYLKGLNGTPREVLDHPELLQVLLPMLRSDFEVCQTYEYVQGERLSCPITAYGGILDSDISRQHLEAWREQTSADFKLVMFPGDHFYINTSAPLLLRALDQELRSIVSQAAWRNVV